MDNPVCVFNDRIFVKDNKNYFVKVEISDIFWIKGGGSYSVIETAKGQFTTSHNLKCIETKIQNINLVRVHRSYIINLLRVKQIKGKNFVVLDIINPNSFNDKGLSKEDLMKAKKEVEIPIGPEYRDNLHKIFKII